MSNAGYGNHDAPPPGGTDRADRAASPGAAPSAPAEKDTGKKTENTADHTKTPGSGALPDDAQGREVDPGAG